MTDFASRLLGWFAQHGRKDLPWQRQITFYRVWVSEIMLQQTQVATVIPYYERFMLRFPTINSLAAATEDEVLHAWTGLGYYARARNLHATAKEVVSSYNGLFPKTLEALVGLRGIGRSTAGAMVAICTGERATILDGNVKRLLSRCFAIDGLPGTRATESLLWKKADQLTPYERVSDYTQAIMDLGAMICTRRAPDCGACPFTEDCIARATDSIDRYPRRRPAQTLPIKTTTMLVIQNSAGAVLLQKRQGNGLWGGLWSFPECELDRLEQFLGQHHLALKQRNPLPGFRHSFTHFHLDIELIQIAVKDAAPRIAEPLAEGALAKGALAEKALTKKTLIEGTPIEELRNVFWYDPREPAKIGLPKPVSKTLLSLPKLGYSCPTTSID